MPRKPHKYHYLYKTTNLINNKFYVGMHSTSNMEDGYLGSGKYLKRSIKKYGKENFKIEYLEFFSAREILIEEEMKLVDKDFIKDPLCMNLCIGGKGAAPNHSFNLGSKRTDETKLKMSLWVRTDEMKRKISKKNKGKKRAEETKLKYSIAKKGKKFSAEARLNIANGNIGKNKGRKHTDETKLNMSIAHLGKKFSPYHKKKLSESHFLNETKIKIILDNIGKMSYRKIGVLANCTHGAVIRTIKRYMPNYQHKLGDNLLEEWQIQIIIDNYGKISNKKIAKLADCSSPTVINTIKRINEKNK